jgi:hypothetical protein
MWRATRVGGQVEELRESLRVKEGELEALRATTPADLWQRDLDALEEAWNAYTADLEIEPAYLTASQQGKRGKGKQAARAKKTNAKPKGTDVPPLRKSVHLVHALWPWQPRAR